MSPTTEIPGAVLAAEPMPAPGVASAVHYCAGLTASGAPCRQVVGLNGSGFCLFHDPARVDERKAVQAEGGRIAALEQALARERESRTLAGTAPALELTLDGVAHYQKWAIEETVAGRMAPTMLSKVSYALQQLRTVLLGRDVEQRIAAALEQWERFKREHPS